MYSTNLHWSKTAEIKAKKKTPFIVQLILAATPTLPATLPAAEGEFCPHDHSSASQGHEDSSAAPKPSLAPTNQGIKLTLWSTRADQGRKGRMGCAQSLCSPQQLLDKRYFKAKIPLFQAEG